MRKKMGIVRFTSEMNIDAFVNSTHVNKAVIVYFFTFYIKKNILIYVFTCSL